MTAEHNTLFGALLGAIPTLLVAFVLERRHLRTSGKGVPKALVWINRFLDAFAMLVMSSAFALCILALNSKNDEPGAAWAASWLTAVGFGSLLGLFVTGLFFKFEKQEELAQR